MKMVKSLLLGSAATFVAAAGAQAADLPMKAKAVEYVKVCSLYGAGYYYIPGTDTCIKIGGIVRFDTAWNGDVSGATNFVSGGNGRFNQAETNYYNWRARYLYTFDVRSQTEYGTLRAYVRAGFQYTTGTAPAQGDNGSGDRSKDGGAYTDRAFIQFAGFTFGKTQSFFDVWSATGVANANLWGYDDTGNGINLFAYTAMLGNGVSLSIAAEDPQAYRRMTIYNSANGDAGFGTAPANNYGGTAVPDIVGTLRVDQAWGSAMIGGLVHEVRPTYYYTAAPSQYVNGHPDNKYGWAVTAGADLNLPWAKGDRFIIQGTYTEGVLGTIMGGINNTVIGIWKGGSTDATKGIIVDATYEGAAGPLSQLQLTTGWAVIAGVEHYWVPTLRSSLFGSYTAIRYNGSVDDFTSGAHQACHYINLAEGGVCNPNLNLWQVGTRTVWTPVPNLDISLETVYGFVDQNNSGTVLGSTVMNGAGIAGSNEFNTVDKGVWTFNFRVQRNFWP